MNPGDRFYGCETLGFPEVINYDYLDNIPIRGINDRSFRWEEVAVQSIYQMQEATYNGSFETNFYTGTGVINYITTGNSYLGFTGWVLTGSDIIYIGMSGINTDGMTGQYLFAQPIDGDVALGLQCSSLSNPPVVYSTPIATGVEGPFVLEGTHQLFLQSKLNIGSTANLKAYIRGWSAGNIVANYEPSTSNWITGIPTGYFPVSSGITTIKYDFECSSFPAATPDHFDVYISNISLGTFVTIDNVHVDAYFRKNAFLDYIVPTGYMLQVTPDLGWHDVMSMFNSNEDRINPHLKTLGPYLIENGNLTDNLDNTVTATMDESDFRSVTSETFNKYLWRALALSPNGTLSPGGLPNKFEYVGNKINTYFTVDGIKDDALSSIKIITGKKSSTMTILVDGQENHPNLEYPTTTSWKLTIYLLNSSKTLNIQGKEAGGNRTYTKQIKLTSKVFEQNEQALWNVFDEHGLVSDVERLPNESNYDYSLRIKDSYVNRGGPSFVGIVNGGTRELNLIKINDAIKVNISKNTLNKNKTTNVEIEVTSYSIRVTTPSQYITETLLVDPVYSTVDLTYRPVELPVFSTTNINKIDFKEKDIVQEEDPYIYRIKFNNHEADGKVITTAYRYYYEFFFKDYKTIESIVEELNKIDYIEASISPRLSGGEDCLGLFIYTQTISANSTADISWSPLYLKKISDRGYRDYFVTGDMTIKESEYYSYVKELKNNTKIFWGNVEADRDRWDAADSKNLSMDSIPTLFDPPLSKILYLKDNQETKIDPVAAWSKGYVNKDGDVLRNEGLTTDLFHPGVAHTNDLTPDIYLTSTYIEINSSLPGNVGLTKNDNLVVLFSGQK